MAKGSPDHKHVAKVARKHFGEGRSKIVRMSRSNAGCIIGGEILKSRGVLSYSMKDSERIQDALSARSMESTSSSCWTASRKQVSGHWPSRPSISR
jgi:hypothetical protein